MQYVILDLEANYQKNSNYGTEIISIAAYRAILSDEIITCDNGDYKLVSKIIPTDDCFHTFVKPVFTGRINKKLKKLLKINQEDLENAPTFDVGIELFKDWVNQTNDTTMFITWSSTDLSMILKDCRRHFIPHSWFSNNHFDLQRAYDLSVNRKKPTSLLSAISELNIKFVGEQHNALDDSYNTMQILYKTV